MLYCDAAQASAAVRLREPRPQASKIRARILEREILYDASVLSRVKHLLNVHAVHLIASISS
jgi:hypothetical protein